MTPFDIIASISQKKNYLLETETDEKAYIPFIVNRSFSFHIDTLLYANEINQAGHLDKKLQHDYLFYSISPKKRWSKWHKRKQDDNVELISQYYKYNVEKAKAVLPLFSKEQLKQIKKELEQGGANE